MAKGSEEKGTSAENMTGEVHNMGSNTENFWNPVGGEIVGMPMLIEIDEINPSGETEPPRAATTEIARLLIEGKLGICTDFPVLGTNEDVISEETLNRLLNSC